MRHRLTATVSAVATIVLVAVACTAPTTPPVPNFVPFAVVAATPQAGVAPLEVEFSGLDSYDSDGQITGYIWSFGDGGTSTEAEPTHTYVNPGTYNARLIVTDDDDANSAPVIVPIEVTFDFAPIVLVDDDGVDDAACGTTVAPCASIAHGVSRAQTDAKTQVWVAEGEYSAFTVAEGIDVRGGYDAAFTSTGGASVVNGAFDAGVGVSAAIVAVDVDDTTVDGFTAVGADESENGRSALAAFVGGTGSGLELNNMTLTGGEHGAAATALLIDGASSVSLSTPTISAGDAAGAGNSSYGVLARNGATVTVDGGTIEAGYGANGAAGGEAPAAPATAGNGNNGGNGSFGSRGSGGSGAAGASRASAATADAAAATAVPATPAAPVVAAPWVALVVAAASSVTAAPMPVAATAAAAARARAAPAHRPRSPQVRLSSERAAVPVVPAQLRPAALAAAAARPCRPGVAAVAAAVPVAPAAQERPSVAVAAEDPSASTPSTPRSSSPVRS